MDQNETGPEKLGKDTTQDKDTISPCGQNDIAPPQPEKKVIIVADDVRIAGHSALLANGEAIAADCKPVEPPPGINDFGELGYTEENKKAQKAIEEHKPTLAELFPHVQRKKVHPHKRSLDPEQRTALRTEGKAWWIRGGNSALASLPKPNKAGQGGSIPQVPSSEVANG